MISSSGSFAQGLCVFVVSLTVLGFLLYWVVRLGVRHAIEDADRRRTSQRG